VVWLGKVEWLDDKEEEGWWASELAKLSSLLIKSGLDLKRPEERWTMGRQIDVRYMVIH